MDPWRLPLSAVRLLPLAALLIGTWATAGPLAAFEPRPLSEAERGAVEIALAFAERGPEAVWDRLAQDAPLRALGREAALAEISARLGAREGTAWTLETPSLDLGPAAALFSLEFASGVDDRLRLELVERGGWRVRNLWTLADRPPPIQAPLRGTTASLLAPSIPAASVRSGQGVAGWWLLLAPAAALGSGGARRRRALGVGGALALLACGGGGVGERAKAPGAAFVQPRLGALAGLRSALAAGVAPGADSAPAPSLSLPPESARVAELWRAQLRIVAGDLAGGEAQLGTVERPDDPPLAALLRARSAALRLSGGAAAESYESVARAGFDSDGLRLEQLGVALVTEAEYEASALPLLVTGSRRAEPWYQAAAEGLVNDQDELAESALKTAWQLTPLPRDEVFAEPALAALAARPVLFPLFELGSPVEPQVTPQGARRPLALPAGASGRLCGRLYTLEAGGIDFEVPGGAELAPAGTPVEDAASRRRRAEERALAAFGGVPSALGTAPRGLRLAQTAARALARDGQWQELLDLTGPLVARAGVPAPELLVRLNALALERLERGGEAKTALAGLATRQLRARRPAPGTLYDLAELLAADDEYDTAIRLIKKADAQLGKPHGEQRLRQFELSRELARTAREHRSRHFVVRYPAATGDRYGEQLATVLEAERQRLLAWIPQPGERPIEVELFPLEEFLSAYGGDVEVVGIYDGRLRMPFADLRSLDPRLVAIVSHELAHALLTGATRGQAPHWFQEGLAQHIEMGSLLVNPLPELEASGRTLAFPALEPILDGFSEPQLVELAYAESAWAVAYIEKRWGVDGVRRLVRAFASGASTERAIAALGGGELAGFDRAFRDWGARLAPASRRVEARRFDRELDRPFAAATTEAKAGREAVSDLTLGAKAGSRPPTEAEIAAMRGWHARYLEATAPVRRAYAPVARAFATGAGQPSVEQCAALRGAAEELIAARAADLGAPDVEIANQLRRVYQHLVALGASCEAGRGIEAVGLYERIGVSLGRAATQLAPFGLKP